jgi:hypothetical protein
MNPTIGDLIDRLMILALKIEECDVLRKDSKHFRDEAAEIGFALEKSATPNASMYCRIARLAAINAMIWFAEEAVAQSPFSEGEPTDHIEVLRVLVRIRDLNRVRAKVIDAFEPARGKEKAHDIN